MGQARCGETWMRWIDFEGSQELQSKDLVQSWAPELEPRAHEKNCVCVSRARCARCGVMFTFAIPHPPISAFGRALLPGVLLLPLLVL